MTEGEKRRQRIFEIYKDNLNLLVDCGLVQSIKDVYVCPLCLKAHSSIHEIDPLTLEDAPPKSLGGKANILTCKSCNNTMGTTVDFHLAERLRELDNSKFIPGTEVKVQVKIDGETLQAKLHINLDGTIQLEHSKKNNHPTKLDAKMKELKGGTVVNLNFLKTKVIPENLEFAILKTGYLLAFQKFGYSLILNNCYDSIREQLRNPEKRTYPIGFWFQPSYPKEYAGVYFVVEKGIECILSLFNVTTGKSERMFGVLLPLPINPIQDVIKTINDRIEREVEFVVELFPHPNQQQEMNYLRDVTNITRMFEWIKARSKKSDL